MSIILSVQAGSIISRSSHIRPLSMTHRYARLSQWPHFRVNQDHARSYAFFALNFDRTEIEDWSWSHCSSRWDASPDMQHYQLGSQCDLKWPWPYIKFWPFNVNRYMFRCVSTREHNCVWIISLAFIFQKLLAKNRLVIWSFGHSDLHDPRPYWSDFKESLIIFNLRPVGGGGGAFWSHHQDFANSGKMAFSSYINFTPLQKILAQGHLRSGHQVRSSDPT